MRQPIGYPSFFVTVTFLAAVLSVCSGCDELYPEVVVTNTIDEHILIRNISFNGCKWDETLAFEESSSPGRCLAGSDRIHFQRFNPKTYCEEQVEDETIDGLCFCNEEDKPAEDPMDTGLINEEPMWFNYQTLKTYDVSGGFHLFELTLENMEQDFSVPGPYGH